MTAPLAARLRAPALVGLAGAALGTALVLRDPHASGSWGFCPFLLVTGVPCPACGGLRATNDLLHGRLTDAAGSNLYAVLTALVAAVAFVWWAGSTARGRDWAGRRHLPRALNLWFIGLLAFGALRLVPGLSGLRP
jgi:hypothetical protein